MGAFKGNFAAVPAAAKLAKARLFNKYNINCRKQLQTWWGHFGLVFCSFFSPFSA
jgi:hypothetical protein